MQHYVYISPYLMCLINISNLWNKIYECFHVILSEVLRMRRTTGQKNLTEHRVCNLHLSIHLSIKKETKSAFLSFPWAKFSALGFPPPYHLFSRPLWFLNKWTIQSMITRTMFPPARPAPTWPKSQKNTPRPTLTTAVLMAAPTTKHMENGQLHLKQMDSGTPHRKAIMVQVFFLYFVAI